MSDLGAHVPLAGDPAELAALYVAGALTPEETAAFEGRLEARDAAYVAALQQVQDVQLAMLEAIAPAPVNPAVRAALEAYINRPADDDAYIQRGDANVWKPLLPGIAFRMMFVDRARHTQTLMLKIDPGAAIPAHDHAEAEECYVVEGELETLGTVLRGGDYFRLAGRTTHAPSRTRTGCTLLVTSAIDEEFAAAWQ